LVCSNEPLAHVLRVLGFSWLGNAIGIAAILALPSVILILIFGQTRIFFVMSRDGLLPEVLSRVHPKFRTPHVVTAITGTAVAIAAAFFPVGQLADISNAGTLYAFLMVAVAVMMLRVRDPNRPRSFRVPGVWIIAPLTIAGCAFLFLNLPTAAMLFLPIWTVVGLFVYFLYSRSRSHLGRGIVEVHEPEYSEIEPDIPGVPDLGQPWSPAAAGVPRCAPFSTVPTRSPPPSATRSLPSASLRRSSRGRSTTVCRPGSIRCSDRPSVATGPAARLAAGSTPGWMPCS